ncbi:C40 family peptidase (plasmid) [Nocardia sp. NBC_01377]|uniref:C40 family peptidase n=1 Tax=Nocardia sp. NBC_01377 TaxID=2903595 RepID=UPI0032486E37
MSTPVAAVPADAIPAEPQAQATDSDQEIVRDAAALNRAAVAVMKQRGTVIPQQQALNILNASKGHKIAAALSQQPAIPQGAFGTLPAVPQGGLQFPNLMEDHSPAAKALDAARSKVGAQYSWGAAGPVSFDCSGLVQWAFRQAGVELPRTSFEQSHVGAPVAFQNLQPGDIVITNGGGHVGIYAGDGKLLNAVQSGTPVSYTHLDADDVVTARRVV